MKTRFHEISKNSHIFLTSLGLGAFQCTSRHFDAYWCILMCINAMMPIDAYDECTPDSITQHITSCNKCDGDCNGRMGGGYHLVGGQSGQCRRGWSIVMTRLEGLMAHSCEPCCWWISRHWYFGINMLYGCVCINVHRYTLMWNRENKKARILTYLVCSTKIKKQTS